MVDIDKAVVAKLKTNGQYFEILVDCDAAIKFREGQNISLSSVVAAQQIFSDAKKGLLASESQMQAIFGSSDPLVVAEKIIKKGEIQVTSEYKSKLREKKLKKILEIIHKNGVDPRTNTPHPIERLSLAFDEAKVKIDEHRGAEEQIERIIKELRPILPIRVEKSKIAIRIPSIYAGKAYSAVVGYGKLIKDEWQNDGSWAGVVDVPAGMQQDLIDSINKLTHGDVDIKIIKSNEGE